MSYVKLGDVCSHPDQLPHRVSPELYFPPYVYLETDEYVRIAGEELKIRCTTHNPNFNYNVTWKYNTKSVSTHTVHNWDLLA